MTMPPPTLPALADLVGARLDLPADESGPARVTGATLDSRRVHPGDLYAALPGARTHGAAFAAEAVAAGAVGVLTDEAGRARLGEQGITVPMLVHPDPRGVLGTLAARIYGDPADGLTTLAVTGTNGKTTTTYLLDGALTALGRTTGLIGTVETKVAGERVRSVRTTPESPDLQRLLAQMLEAGVQVASMEVSSHALALHRVDAVRFTVAGFTNLTQDHLDFHATMENYFEAKAALFEASRCDQAVVCTDDAWGARLAARIAERGEVPLSTLSHDPAAGVPTSHPGDEVPHWTIATSTPRPDGSAGFTLIGSDGSAYDLDCPLPGGYNVTNTALAFLMLCAIGIEPAQAAAGLAQVPGVPGRMQRVLLDDEAGWPEGQPLAVVDYAHSPDAIAQALAALRPATPGRLVVVLGAGGDRDSGKRPTMGAAAVEGADVVVITDDNPRSEDPAEIREALLRGARRALDSPAGQGTTLVEVAGRRAAIEHAVRLLTGQADTLLLAGKGHETGQEIAGVVHPFDDAVVLGEALAAHAPGSAAGPGGTR